MTDNKLHVSVRYDKDIGYVATVPGRPPIAALSLGGLRKQVEVLLRPDEPIIMLDLDREARRERDRRRAQPFP
jgi:hypothetical protein